MGDFAHIIVLILALLMTGTARAQTQVAAPARPIKVVAFGDSLTAGLGLPANQAFPVRLQKSLESKGIKVDMVNAGVDWVDQASVVDGNLISARTPADLGPWMKALLAALGDSGS